MERLLVIDSCMRPESRTRKILEAAKEALSSRYEIECIDVNAAGLLPVTPFWDMSFPAVLKTFFENMSLFGVTFTDNGETCIGLCQCKKVMYITTRGMNIETGSLRDQGSSYLQALSSLWGLGEVTTVAVWNLDYLSPEEVDKKVREASSLVKALAVSF